MFSNKLLKLAGIFLTLCVLGINVASAESIDRASLEKQATLALGGYDATTYFNLSGAQKGNDAFQAVYHGERYLFTSEENQQKFAKNPAQYLPEFGGLCAQSLVMEKDVIANPAIYMLQEGKLYMFVSQEARTQWAQNAGNNLVAANKHWMFESEKRHEQIAAKKRWKTNNTVKLFSF
ncbi:YHS domain-containing (seleno)protein [Paraglaciecola sp. 20A4]|uniref:YHS domain-containing (seleno)protein n=1 Tax=Paraglaciecola sp. 20A4 TaxID=2687288 RepID=UPI001409A7B1|nr:YHS domain-containing (seleno)protein [Paraglaciecola sp. 20A4]